MTIFTGTGLGDSINGGHISHIDDRHHRRVLDLRGLFARAKVAAAPRLDELARLPGEQLRVLARRTRSLLPKRRDPRWAPAPVRADGRRERRRGAGLGSEADGEPPPASSS